MVEIDLVMDVMTADIKALLLVLLVELEGLAELEEPVELEVLVV